MGPKSFTACYVCLKEFGSKSIALHEPLCLNRWRASNRNLPADKRSSTPVKNADKNQNNPSWVCSHCQVKRSSHAGSSHGKTSSKRKSNSPKQAQSHCAKLVKADCGDQCANSGSPKQVISDCTKLVKSCSPKQGRSDCAKIVKSGDECKKSRLDCTKLFKCGNESCSYKQARSDCANLVQYCDECTNSRVDCTNLVKCGNECTKSCSPKQTRSDCTKLVKKCGDECMNSRSDCTKLVKCGDESGSLKQVRSDCTKLVKKCGDECMNSRSDCTKLVKCGDESSSVIIKHIHSVSVDRLKGLGSPKQQSKSNIPKQVSSDCGHMTGVAKPDFSPKKGKENKNNNNSNQIPSVVKKNAKNEAKPDPIVPPEDPIEISSTSRRSVRPQTKILRRPTPNLNHPVIQVDSDDSSGDSSSSSDKSNKDENPKRLKMGEEEEEETPQKPKNFIIYNKNNVDRKLKSKETHQQQPKERNSATLQTAIPNPCNSCNRSLAPERLHSHAKKDSRGLMYRKSPTLDVKMSSPQKKQDDATKPNNVIKVSKLPKAVPVTPDQDNKRTTTDTLQVPDAPKSDVSSEDISAEEEKDLVDMVKACYICQKEFKVSSLLLHESKCLESWKKTNNSLTPNLRQLPPQRPDEDPPEDPVWTSVQSQLVPCASCGRTFFPERLPVHRRVCKGKPSPRALKRTSSLREHSASSSDGDGPRPAAVYVPCYVCGRNYGSWVISMHEQQCIRRWRGENQELPDEEKKEEPAKPERQEDEDVTSLVELGDNAWESHLQQLVPCPLCTRTFFPDRLGVHKRSCKGPSNGARRPKSNKGA